MSGTSFEVDLDWLAAVGNGLSDDTEALKPALDAMEETGPKRTGHKELDKACDSFSERWSYGIQVIQGDLKSLSEKITESRKSYTRTESAAETRVTPSASGITKLSPAAPQGGRP